MYKTQYDYRGHDGFGRTAIYIGLLILLASLFVAPYNDQIIAIIRLVVLGR